LLRACCQHSTNTHHFVNPHIAVIMRYFNVVSFALVSSLLSLQVVADPLDEAIALFRRQVSLSTGGTSETTTEEETTTSPTSVPSTVTDSDSVTEETSVTTEPPSTTVEVSTSTQSQPTQETTSEETSSRPSASSAVVTSTRVPTQVTSNVLTTFTTVTDGQTRVGTSTSQTVVPTETDVDPASLSGGGNGGGSSGLSDSAKKTIGGVVGGVGGALLLAGLGYTAWRIWGKKKDLHDDDAYDPNMAQDKLSSSTADNSSASPFNRTLDQYHQPGPVNQASNF